MKKRTIISVATAVSLGISLTSCSPGTPCLYGPAPAIENESSSEDINKEATDAVDKENTAESVSDSEKESV